MMFGRTSVGGLLLDEAAGWTFSVHNGVIAGKYRNEPGVLRISTIASNLLAQPVTHEMCLSHAMALAGVSDATPSDWATSRSVTGPFGSANFDRGPDRVYVWYCFRSPGLIVGTYSCPIELARTLVHRGLRIQCNGMITTAVFDRRTWGADDELTRWMTALLGADDTVEEADHPPDQW